MDRRPRSRVVLFGTALALATLMSVMSVTSGAITPASPSSSHPARGHRSRTCPCRAPTASASLRVPSSRTFRATTCPAARGRSRARSSGSSAPPTAAATGPGASRSLPSFQPASTASSRVWSRRLRTAALHGAPGELASLSVSPTQGTAGTDFYVTVAGTLCRGTDPSVDVGVFDPTLETADEFVARERHTGRGRDVDDTGHDPGRHARGDLPNRRAVPARRQPVLPVPAASDDRAQSGRARASPARGDAPRPDGLSRCPWTAWT